MSWDEPINVTIKVQNFRIGSASSSEAVDLPVSESPLFFTSSFKGILRASTRQALATLSPYLNEDLELSLFGQDVLRTRNEAAVPQMEGKIRIELQNPDLLRDEQGRKPQKVTFHGIRLSRHFKSVEYQALFTYESFVAMGDTIDFTFSIVPIFPLTDDELAVLVAGIHGLRWGSFGGFVSRGQGLILEGIIIEPHEAVRIAQQHLKAILHAE